MNKNAVRPLVRDIKFQGYDRALHPELFEFLSSFEVAKDDYRLRLHLTRGGHVIEWRHGDIVLAEVLCENGAPLPENRQLFEHRVGKERSERHHPISSVLYMTCFQRETLPANLYFHLHDELRRDGEQRGLLCTLHSQDRLGLSPFSYVDLQSRPGSLLIHAYHTFPVEYSIVKTQTLIEIDA